MVRKVSAQELSHDYVEERLSAYVDGGLPEPERVQVRRHLQTCPRCQASLDALGWTIKLLKQVPAPPLPRQFTLPMPEPKPVPAPWMRWGLAAASALAAVAFVSLVMVDILSQRAGSTQVAMPAAASAPHTLVAIAPSTRTPAVLDRAAAPTSAPLPQSLPASPPEAATAAPAATGAARPTPQPKATEVLTQSEPASPTEARAPLVAKSAPPSPPCEGCGGGIGGGGPLGTPQPSTVTPASTVEATGTVRDSSVTVRTDPSEQAQQIGFLARGIDVQVLKRDETGDWLQIIFPVANDQGLTGWVTTKAITLPIPLDTLPTGEPSTETPIPPPGMTFNAQQGTLSPPGLLAKKSQPDAIPQSTGTVSQTETSPPTATALATATSRPTRTPTPTATPSPTRTLPAQSSASPLRPTPISQPETTEESTLRLGEVASLLISVVLGAAAFFVFRT
jgi:putative zinc finger protein/SH3 domain-containing protein